MDDTNDAYYKQIKNTVGSRESTQVYLRVDKNNGEAELVIEKTISERYPVTDHEKVMDLHARLTRGNGRRVYSLEDLTE